ncbi:MAG: catalase [Burkholderiaceae bacterium]|nr:catalase [Burkholderiaceae bacterium]
MSAPSTTAAAATITATTTATNDNINQGNSSITSNQAATVKLSREAQSLVNQLQATDRKVRAHELAHLAASGGLATGAPSYTYQRGPDGVSYAVGGEVSIDTSAGRTPEETLAKAEQVIAAALAPADPSGADQAVAAAASQRAQQARAEIVAQQTQETNQGANSVSNQGTDQGANRVTRSDRTNDVQKSYGNAASDITSSLIAAQSQRIDSYA